MNMVPQPSLSVCCCFGSRNVMIYETVSSDPRINDHLSYGGVEYGRDVHPDHVDTAPRQILLRIPPPQNAEHWAEAKQMELVVDEAGKVRSARIMTPIFDNFSMPEVASAPSTESDKNWLAAAAGWKYIPALKLGRPKPFRSMLFVQRDQ